VLEVASSLVAEFTSEITDRIWNTLEPVLRQHGRQDVFGVVVEPTIPPLPMWPQTGVHEPSSTQRSGYRAIRPGVSEQTAATR
jgi:hypothetical protein